jgi:hypothetical protein
MIVPFGEEGIDASIAESTVLYLSRLRHQADRSVFESALITARADAHRAKAATDADERSRDRAARRTIERTAPTMTPEDMSAIHRIMVERRCSGIEAAVYLGQERMKAEQ